MSKVDLDAIVLGTLKLSHKDGPEHTFEVRAVRYRDSFGFEQRCVNHGMAWEDCSRVIISDDQWHRLEHWAQRKLNEDRAVVPRARDEILVLMGHTHQAVIEADKMVEKPYQRARLAFVRQVLATAWACLPEDSQAMLEGLQEVGEILRDMPCGLDAARGKK